MHVADDDYVANDSNNNHTIFALLFFAGVGLGATLNSFLEGALYKCLID